MENLFGIGILLDYQDRASANMLKTQRVFSQTQQTAEQLAEAVEKNNEKFNKLAGMSAKLGIAGLGLKVSGNKVLGVLREAVEESKTFELELANLGIILGATSDEMALLEKRALETGMATMFSPQETVQGMQALAAAGMDLDQVLGSLNHALDLVAVSGGAISLEEGAGVLASTLNKFNLDVSEAERVADMFAHIANLTNFGVEDMPAFINSLGTAPTKIGRSLEEMLAMGGLLSNIGQQSAQAGATVQGFGRQLIMITQQLERGKGTKVDVLKELGLDEKSFWDAEGKMLSMVEVFQNITKATAGLSDMERATALQKLFGDQAGNMINAIEGASRAYLVLDEATGKYIETSAEGKTTFEDIVTGLSDIGGTARNSAKMMEETFWGVEKIKEGVQQTFGVLLGQTVMPILSKFYQGLSGVLEKIVNFGYEHPKFMKALGYGIGLAGLLLTAGGMALILAGAIGGVISGIGILAGKIATLATTWLGLNASMISGSSIASALWLKMRPLATQAGALSLTLGALYLAWKSDFGGIKTIITDFIKRTGQAFSDAKRIIGMNTDDMLSAVRKLEQNDDFFSKLTVGLVKLDTLWKGLTEAWSDYTLSEETFIKLRELGLLPLIEKILDAKMKFDAFFEGIKIGFGIVSEVVQTVVTTIGEWIGKAIGFIRDLISPTREVKDEIDGVNEVTNALNLDVWRDFGVAIGILGGAFVTYKIASMVWDIVSAVGRLGKVIVVDLVPGIFKFIGGLSKKIALMAVDKAETLYLLGLYAKDAVAKGLMATKTLFLTGATKAMAVAQGALNAVMAVNPIVWIILAVVALGVALYALIKNWDKVKEAVLGFVEKSVEWLKGLWEKIKEIFAPVGEFFGKVWDNIVTFFTPAIEFFSNLWQGVVDTVKGIWNGIVNFFSGLFDVVVGIFQIYISIWIGVFKLAFIVVEAIWKGLVAVFSWIWDKISSAAKVVWDGLVAIFTWVAEKAKAIWTPIAEFFGMLWESIVSVAQTIWDGLVSAFQWIVDLVQAIWTPISEFFSGLWEGIVSIAKGLWENFLNNLEMMYNIVIAIWTPIKEFFSGVWNGVKNVATTIWQSILGFIETIVNGIKTVITVMGNVVKGIWEGIKNTASNIWNSVLSVVTTVVDGIKAVWSGITGFFSGIWNGIKNTAMGLFNWLADKFAWVINIVDKVKGVIGGVTEGVKSGLGKVVGGAKKMVGLSTGGYVKTEGIAMLHPNEVVVNDTLTEMLRSFLMRENEGTSSRPVVVNQIQAQAQKTAPNYIPQLQQLAPASSSSSTQNDNSVTFEKGSIQITVEKGTEEDAERFAEMIMKKIEKKKQLKRTMNYGMQPV